MKENYYYTYKIVFVDGYYYYGSRKTTDEPHLDLYWGSPKTMREKWDGTMYHKDIITIHEDYDEMRREESELIGDNYKTDPYCLNRHNNGNFFCSDYSHNRVPKTEEWKSLMSELMKGKNTGKRGPLPEETKEKIRLSNVGQKRNPSVGKKVSQSKVGRKWWNNGVEERFSHDIPDEGWVRGRLFARGRPTE